MADIPTDKSSCCALDPYAGHTPLMRQYFALRDQHPGVLLLFRLGDFYETFFDDAVRISRLLGLTLTRRGNHNGKPIPMAGIPASTLEQYLARLVRYGESVAISEQTESAGAEKSSMMERRIVCIVTPGTLTDNALLSEKADSVLLAVSIPKLKTSEIGLIWITLTNGRFCATHAYPGDLADTLARINPSEILVSEKGRAYLKDLGLPRTVTELPDWHFDAERGRERLKTMFSLASLECFGVERDTTILAAANALLDYVSETQCETTPFIEPLSLESQSAFIGLTAETRRNLEIDTTLHEGDGPTLFSTLDTCKTGMGSRLLRSYLTHPVRDAALAKERHQAVAVLLTKDATALSLEDLLKTLPDIERIAGRIALKSIRPKEAAALRDALPTIESIARLLTALSESALIEELTGALSLNAALQKTLKDALLEDPAPLLREGDVIRSEANAELSALRAMRDNAGSFLIDLEAREKERTGISTLRVQYNRVSGYYIEVSRGQAGNVPDDYRRRQTLKNTERFITPELKEYEDKALSAKERARALEKELWDNLVEALAVYVEPLLAAAKTLATVDLLAAFARHALECNWIQPDLTYSEGLEILGARHPVIEKTLEHYVPNDCVLCPGRRLMVITGPNMGGKSTYMRSVALIVLLAYAGSFVPAKAARIGPIDKILTRIGASDDLTHGRSTFMVEMTEAAAILHEATEHSLVLMDEIGRGTSTADGLSLAAAIATELAQKTRSWTLFATHYFELTELVHTLSQAVNVHVCAEQSGGSVVFLHDIKEGPASRSYGIAVAKLAGIRPSVIRRAQTYLKRIEDRAVQIDGQPDLFAGAQDDVEPTQKEVPLTGKEAAFIEALSQLQVDSLSPREALNLVYELQSEAAKLNAVKKPD